MISNEVALSLSVGILTSIPIVVVAIGVLVQIRRDTKKMHDEYIERKRDGRL